MIDIYDSETLVKIYRLLNKKCEAIDNFIKRHAFNFGSCSAEFSTEDVCNNIIELITKKNQLINLKIIVDNAVKELNENDKKLIFMKMNYSLSMEELCSVLELKERTAFRRIERAMLNLANALNHSKYLDKLITIMNEEVWISKLREDVRTRRMAYRTA